MARILIADDQPLMRNILRSILETRRGWQVCYEAAGGQEAVTKSLELKPDLVILDLAMPFVDGLRAGREISRVMPATPIMLYTLFNTPGLDIAAKDAGIRRVVDKAAGARKLIDTVAELLPRQRAQAARRNIIALLPLLKPSESF